MRTVEELLEEAAGKGMTHLTVWPIPSSDGKTTYWSVRATPSMQHSYVQATDTDLIGALRAVLSGLSKAPKRGASIPEPQLHEHP